MKIVLVSEREKPHLVTEGHVRKVKDAAAGAEVVHLFSDQENEIRQQLQDADVAAVWPRTMPPLSEAKNLKWIHSFSAGVDALLTDEIKSSPVLVSNSSGIHAIPIAEHIIAFMLLFTKQFYQTFRQQQQKMWERVAGLEELKDKTVLIVGLGRIGEEAARLAAALGAHVIAVNNEEKEKPSSVEELVMADRMDEVLPRADFVVLSVPHTDATHHMMNGERFKQMKSSAVLINIGRGPVVDEEELIEALQQKTIAGAALDVTEVEPLPKESKLWELDNVIITPHHSGLSEKYMDRAVERFILNLTAFNSREHLPNLVDKEKGY